MCQHHHSYQISSLAQLSYNMTLRDISDSSGKKTISSTSDLAELTTYWNSVGLPTKTEREKLGDLFVVAVNAKPAISVPEIQ